jgi:hypothetical protein
VANLPALENVCATETLPFVVEVELAVVEGLMVGAVVVVLVVLGVVVVVVVVVVVEAAKVA